MNNFTGTKSVNFTIESSTSKPDLGLGSLTLDTNTQKLLNKAYTYTGKEQKPTIKSLSLNGKKLSVNKQYKLVYENNIHAGTATVKAIGIGDYIGSRTLGSFSIKAKLITFTWSTEVKCGILIASTKAHILGLLQEIPPSTIHSF